MHREVIRRVVQHLPMHPHLLVHVGPRRTRHMNRQLAWPLAFVAGAINAGGFLAVGFYTSHVTGSYSRVWDEAALGNVGAALEMGIIVLTFMFGAFCAASFIHLGKRMRFRSPYGGALFVEAILLLIFGVLARDRPAHFDARDYLVANVLSYFMGVLNAIASKISTGEVRATHMTGMATDLSVEVAKLLYWNSMPNRKAPAIVANRTRLRLHAGTMLFFAFGAFVGSLGFKHIGYEAVLPLSALLLAMSVAPVWRDVQVRWRWARLVRAGRLGKR